MKIRSYIGYLLILYMISQPSLWAVQPNQTEIFDGQSIADTGGETEFNNLSNKALDEGSVQVMVILKDAANNDVRPKSQEQEDAHEKIIEKAQDALLNDMPKHRHGDVKRLHQLPIVALSADADDLKKLHASPLVAEIVPDNMNFAAALTTSVAKIGGDAGWGLGFTGAGQTVAILDNGVDKTHPFLVNKIVSEACFSTKNKSLKVTPACRNKKTKDLKPGAASVICVSGNLACTHGTLLASLAAGNSGAAGFAGSGVAPNATIISVKVNSLIKNKKVCGSSTPCSVFFDSDLLRGLEFVYKQRSSFNIAAANVSIGGSSTPKSCKKSPIKKTVDKLKAAGIATVAASGNDGSGKKLSTPACVSGVIAVGTSTDADTVTSFSNSSSQLALLAPGVNIGLIMPGVTQTGFEVVASGTSLSAALATGAWAALKSHRPSDNVDQILAALRSTGVPLLDPKNGIVTPRIQVNQAHAVLP